jgi:hypothetical protein
MLQSIFLGLRFLQHSWRYPMWDSLRWTILLRRQSVSVKRHRFLFWSMPIPVWAMWLGVLLSWRRLELLRYSWKIKLFLNGVGIWRESRW